MLIRVIAILALIFAGAYFYTTTIAQPAQQEQTAKTKTETKKAAAKKTVKKAAKKQAAPAKRTATAPAPARNNVE